jgi:hypothetical protein
MSVGFGIIYLQLPDSAEAVFSIVGSLAIVYNSCALLSQAQAFVLIDILKYWLHDYQFGTQRLWLVICVEFLLTHLRVVVCNLVFCVIAFWMIGYSGSRFYLYFLATYLSSMWCYALAFGLSLTFWYTEVASLLCAFIIGLTAFTTGYMISLNNIPRYLYWFTVINPFRYITELLVVNEFDGGRVFECEGQASPLLVCPLEGSLVIDAFGYEINNVVEDVLITASITAGLVLVGILGAYFHFYACEPRFLTLAWARFRAKLTLAKERFLPR